MNYSLGGGSRTNWYRQNGTDRIIN